MLRGGVGPEKEYDIDRVDKYNDPQPGNFYGWRVTEGATQHEQQQ